MAQANGVHMVPEKYRKTRFMASCWFYLSQNAQLSFKEYQRLSKDTVCREGIFDDVKKNMEMDRIFGNADAVHPPETAEAPAKQHPPQPPPPPNPAMKEALAKGLAQSGQQTAKGPITIERRALAEEWILGHLDEGFAQFKTHHQEPELDKAWFDKIRKKALEPAPQPQEIEPMPTATLKKKTGKAASPDTEKLRVYLRSLGREKLDNLTHKKYVEATRHKSLNGPTFYNEKRKILDNLDGKVPAPKAAGRPKGKATAAAPAKGSMFVTLAEIPVADFKVAPKELKEIALALVRILHPQGKDAEVRILSEPHALEIRVPYR